MTEKETTKDALTEQNGAEKTNESSKQTRHNSRKARATALLVTLSMASCWTPTAKDVAEDQRKIEVTKQSIEQQIKYRKELVKKYNELVRKSQTDPDNIQLQESKAELRDAIKKTEKEIEKLWKKYIKQTKKYNEDVIESIDGTYWLDDELPEDTYDYLLWMIE